MAKRTKVPPGLKRKLIEEAGGKCANPGCPMPRTHLHHIKHWSVYQAHAPEHMIAVCPTCHDSCHSEGGIDDETLYNWKRIVRGPASSEAVAPWFVEPSRAIRVLTGSMAVMTTEGQAAIFTLSNQNKFEFRVAGDDDLFVASAVIKDLSGRPLVRATENYFRITKHKTVQIDRRPGLIRVVVLKASTFLPEWIFRVMWRAVPDFVGVDRVVAFELEVIRPGVVRLQGAFVADDAALVITKDKVYVLRPERNGPVALVGQGDETIIQVSGPVTRTAFAL